MEEAAVQLDQDRFICPICLDLLNDPVTISCGHSYCKSCIQNCWNRNNSRGYKCPQCRQTFTQRPFLGRNTILAEVVEKLKMAERQSAVSYAEPGDVACDVCTGRKRKAVKSCLVCLVSHCEAHLSLHDKLNPAKRHKMIDATKHLQDKICPHHENLMEVYCRTDQQCICYLCGMNEHRGHDTVSTSTGRTEKQGQLEETVREFQQRINQREKKVQELRDAVDSVTSATQAAMEHTGKIFTEMIRSIKRTRSELKDLIRAQEKAAVSWAEGLLKQLEQEIAELRKRHSELEHISRTEDHIHFLQSFQSFRVSPGPVDLPNIPVTRHNSFGDVKKTVSDLKIQVDEACKKTITEITEAVNEVHIVEASKPSPLEDVLQTPEPRTREEFLRYACQLTLDSDTANKLLCLSETNTVVTCEEHQQSYPDHPERFDYWPQVLCRESLTGRHYWEVQWSGDGVCIAMSYKEIKKKEESDDSYFGHNDKSWGFFCSPSGYSLQHKHKETSASGPSSSRIGVYVDHRAGTLSFYSVSDTMTLLHRVQTTFTEPLYPGFVVWMSSKVKLCPLKEKSEQLNSN